jgi:hypothetical protein
MARRASGNSNSLDRNGHLRAAQGHLARRATALKSVFLVWKTRFCVLFPKNTLSTLLLPHLSHEFNYSKPPLTHKKLQKPTNLTS